MRRKRINPKRKTPRVIHPERTAHITGHKRERLHGEARSKRRAEIFERAGGRCEELIGEPLSTVPTKDGVMVIKFRCNRPATEWSHKRHGANKCDCMQCGIASC